MADPIKGDDAANVLTGTEGDDVLLGLGGADMLSGLGGADTLDGGTGADTMTGGAGDDDYFVDVARDTVIERDETGIDTVHAAISYVLGAYVENLILVGDKAGNGTGNGLANTIIGTDRANVLDGGAGNDDLRGGLGNDTYLIDSSLDTVTELAGGGRDTVRASADYVLPGEVENLTLLGAAIKGTGNAGKNLLIGNDQANVLDGMAGGDMLRGGAGDDTYVVDSKLDRVSELAGQGSDTVVASVSWVLGADVENLQLTGKIGFDATGNALDNILTGNDGPNRIDGRDGADTMSGGKGGDTYIVDNVLDQVIEQNEPVASGRDKVLSSVNWTLGANVEDLTLTGTANINGTGNALSNVITGNAGDNVLDGGPNAAGVGDLLIGGAGNDTYIIADDTSGITEKKNGGIDTVVVGSSYYIGSSPYIENVTLSGTGNFQVIGNNGDNVLTGNAGNNLLIGLGGADTLIGGKGDDTYRVYDLTHATFIEAADSGTDLVQAYQSWTLGDNFENLTLIGNLTKGLNGTGNAEDNRIIGTYSANVIDGKAGADYMRGNGGNDTYYVDNPGDIVDPMSDGGGSFGTELVISSIDYVLPEFIDNLTLTGAARRGDGNGLANTITGTDGADTIDGHGGSDTMSGGKGDDTYYVDNAADKVIERGGEGTDTVRASTSYVLGAEIERLVLADGAADGTGNALDNTITGNAVANTLDGGVGADRLEGGAGDDRYIVDNAGDVVVELAGGGIDTVVASLSWTLGATSEHLILTGKLAIDGTGNALDNTITGNANANVIDGKGGADVLSGGDGRDTLLGGDGNDQLAGGGGNDTVQGDAGADTLDGGLGNDTLAGGLGDDHLQGGDGDDKLAGGDGNDQLAGGDGVDVLNGDAGSDTLDGGAGSDTMRGGAGDDTYRVDAPVDPAIPGSGDVVSEAADSGHDTVIASVNWTLGANVEDLTLTGNEALKGSGNTLGNVITGNDGANVLAGGGGGHDRLIGGLGDDTYLVDGPDVTVVEKVGGGFDRMVFSASGTMAANVEVGVAAGSGAVAITGSAGDDVIGGNSAANVLDGAGGNDTLMGHAGADTLRGGAGNDFLFGGFDADTLTGGAGSDQFAVGTAALQGVDTITDFVSGTDTLLVINPYVSGKLLAGGLVFGTSAKDADDIAIYDKASGNLYVDYDGNGPEAKVLLAKFTPGTALVASDILLIEEVSFSQQIDPIEQLLLV